MSWGEDGYDSDSEQARREAMTPGHWPIERDQPKLPLPPAHYPTSPTTTTTTTTTSATPPPRARSLDAATARHSLPPVPVPVPAVPAIPDHLLAGGKRATLRPSSSGGEGVSSSSSHSSPRSPSSLRSRSALASRRRTLGAFPVPLQQTEIAGETQAESESESGMQRLVRGRGRSDDLFLELANDEDTTRSGSRTARASSQLSSFGNERSRASGHVWGNNPSDLQRHVERYRDSPSRASFQADDAVSLSARSRTGRPQQRYAAFSHRSSMPVTENVTSPDRPQYSRRPSSFGVSSSYANVPRTNRHSMKQQDSPSESPAESSDPKQSPADSASADSETQDTVWDELDDLKSRIKKLELTGKPLTPGVTVSAEQNDRPRTATTAPTTINSSPRHEKKPDPDQSREQNPSPETSGENANGGPSAANIHPLLHSALAKAKPLINTSLYRSLEATATDALQLAAMTGGAGPQGTAYSSAAIINGITVSDRHVRRKADLMCRNLTDLCLALCEGKHESSSMASTPVTMNTPINNNSPSLHYARSSAGARSSIGRPSDVQSRSGGGGGGGRPMSRLEARRSSILGPHAGHSPRETGEDNSEHESTTAASEAPSTRFTRTASRLQTARARHLGGEPADDEDPTIRPASRAMTDIGRAKPSGPRDYSTTPLRSPSLAARRANAGAYESNSRLASGRRFQDPQQAEYQPAPPPPSTSQRRVLSLNTPSSSSRRSTAGEYNNLPGRTTSLSQRRQHIVVE